MSPTRAVVTVRMLGSFINLRTVLWAKSLFLCFVLKVEDVIGHPRADTSLHFSSCWSNRLVEERVFIIMLTLSSESLQDATVKMLTGLRS